MFEPIRGGTRGGQAEFKWSDVSADKDRENYLGHSINAPTGRWQKNKDIHWYSRDMGQDEEARLEEIRKIKEAEAEALAAALGFAAGSKTGGPNITGGPATGSNAVAVPSSATSEPQRDLEKEERRRRKAERREEKRLKKEKRRSERDEGDRGGRSRHPHSRSRSPQRRDESRSRHRSRTPPVLGSRTYDDIQREKERERDRRRWDDNAHRERPRWGRD
ncbi:hypothetical protein PHLCEN_2v149 [Hermanssonia centrifuga]|uniref:Multiple myeloma tumor-associated protein 2-like N-terminal domain-containing protein n=1 Tax=Hermanssonia centrifuga TaxID=98765 RepID=A0A2R6S757_9APHY|nr:hypothetical protein PHLCEN_2v149 [Hermanssonia centrifuga]